MKKSLYKAYAKINLYLKVLGDAPEGYHELDMIMIPLELHDSLLVEELKNSVDNYVTMDDYSLIEQNKNLSLYALDLFEERFETKNKYKILIHKRIPIRAGLGGGSSDAATTLKICAERSKHQIPEDKLYALGKKLGADVSFFLQDKPCRCKGIGDLLEPIEIKNNYFCIIVTPKHGCSTKQVYDAFVLDKSVNNNIEDVIKALKEGDDTLLANSVYNDLEKAASDIVPEIQEAKNLLRNQGLNIVLMSGSGSSVFGLTTDGRRAKQIEKTLYKQGYNVILTKIRK